MNIVLAGNPNVGKSSLFCAMTGAYAEVSNYPGTTVDFRRARAGAHTVIDAPGIYGVSSLSADERAAREMILAADAVINIVDSTRLARDLFLTLQLIDMEIPMILCLNMSDELSENGGRIDLSQLEKRLGIPVLPICARLGRGAAEVLEAVKLARAGIKTPGLEIFTRGFRGINPPAALLAAEDDPRTLSDLCLSSGGFREKIYKLRRAYADRLAEDIFLPVRRQSRVSTALGKLMLRPLCGVLISAALLGLIFYIVGVLVAQTLSDNVQAAMISAWPGPQIRAGALHFFGADSALYRISAGRFGLFTLLPAYLFGLFIPLVATFNFLLAILEDSGLLPRMAAVCDRGFTKIGLNGRAAIPMVLGFGCVTAAIISTRVLGTRRERLIATALLGLTVPCSAQTGVIIGLLAPLGGRFLAAYAAIILLIFTGIGTVLNKLLKGGSEPLIIDLPRIRLPQFKNVLKKTLSKTKGYALDAGLFFTAALLLMGVLDATGVLTGVILRMRPLVTGVLKLPQGAASAFLLGMIRRDFGAAGLLHLGMTPLQTLTAAVTLTLFVPCIASVAALFTERRAGEALAIWLGSILLAISSGALIALLGGAFF